METKQVTFTITDGLRRAAAFYLDDQYPGDNDNPTRLATDDEVREFVNDKINGAIESQIQYANDFDGRDLMEGLR